MTHPLCRWLTELHQSYIDDDEPPQRIRVHAERLLLRRHRPEDRYAPVCGYDAEPWPCFTWRTVAAGWGWCDGYDRAWHPIAEPAHDLDWLTLKEET